MTSFVHVYAKSDQPHVAGKKEDLRSAISVY